MKEEIADIGKAAMDSINEPIEPTSKENIEAIAKKITELLNNRAVDTEFVERLLFKLTNRDYFLKLLFEINFAYKGHLYFDNTGGGRVLFRSVNNFQTFLNNINHYVPDFESKYQDKIKQDKQQELKMKKAEQEKEKKLTQQKALIKALSVYDEKVLADELRRRGFQVSCIKTIKL